MHDTPFVEPFTPPAKCIVGTRSASCVLPATTVLVNFTSSTMHYCTAADVLPAHDPSFRPGVCIIWCLTDGLGHRVPSVSGESNRGASSSRLRLVFLVPSCTPSQQPTQSLRGSVRNPPRDFVVMRSSGCKRHKKCQGSRHPRRASMRLLGIWCIPGQAPRRSRSALGLES